MCPKYQNGTERVQSVQMCLKWVQIGPYWIKGSLAVAHHGYPADWQPAKKATLPLWQAAFLSLIALSKRQP